MNNSSASQQTMDFSEPRVMGILNVTPDSFFDGGLYQARDQILRRAEQIVNEGAYIIDIGGESTRPGALPVPLAEELDRVIPVIELVKKNFPIFISVDTRKPQVMRAALAQGIHLINDVDALGSRAKMLIAATYPITVCLTHMQGEPSSMQRNPSYKDVVQDVYKFLEQRVAKCIKAGIERERLIIDPGFGFGKSLQHNLTLLKHLDVLQSLGLPVLVGLSRKGMIQKALGLEIEERLAPSLALAVLSVTKGAKIIRVHDVKETVHAVQMTWQVLQQK